jgi:hypothetical protein
VELPEHAGRSVGKIERQGVDILNPAWCNVIQIGGTAASTFARIIRSNQFRSPNLPAPDNPLFYETRNHSRPSLDSLQIRVVAIQLVELFSLMAELDADPLQLDESVCKCIRTRRKLAQVGRFIPQRGKQIPIILLSHLVDLGELLSQVRCSVFI